MGRVMLANWPLCSVLVSGIAADARDFVYGNYHIPWHEADVVNSEFDCLSNEMCAEIGQCDACKGHGALGYCCNVLDKTGACPDGMIDAIKKHTVDTHHTGEAHFNAHHGGAMEVINYCIEIQDFDYEGDGYLTDGIKYAIPFHAHDATDIVDCYTDCSDQAGRCEFCDHEYAPGYCCPFVAELDEFQCIDDHNDEELFGAISNHYRNLNHLFEHHQGVPFHTCVAMNCHGVEIIGVDCTSDFKLHLTVNLGCFKEEFEGVAITDLIFSPVGKADDRDDNSCFAFKDGDSGDNFWFSDEALTTAADSETCEMWLDVSSCGLTPTTDDSGHLVYNIALSTYQDPDSVLILKAGMTERLITCQYEGDLTVKTSYDNKIIVDKKSENGENKQQVVGETAQIAMSEIARSVDIQDETGDFVDLATDVEVILGTEMKVTFSTGLEFASAGFYIKSCEGANIDDSFTLSIVESGCAKSSAEGAMADISPRLVPSVCADGTCSADLLFSQFGFIAANSPSKTKNPKLEFVLKCTVAFGPAPTCTGSRRSQGISEDESDTELITYALSLADGSNFEGGVATKRDSGSATLTCSLLLISFYIF